VICLHSLAICTLLFPVEQNRNQIQAGMELSTYVSHICLPKPCIGIKTPKIVRLMVSNPIIGCNPDVWYSFHRFSTSNGCTIHQLPGKGTVGKQQVLSEEYSSVKQLYYTTSCRKYATWWERGAPMS